MLYYDNYYNLRYVLEVKPEWGKLSLLNIYNKTDYISQIQKYWYHLYLFLRNLSILLKSKPYNFCLS